MKCEILIQNGSTIYSPAVEEGIEWTTQRKGSPGKLTFKVIMDEALQIQEGNAVQFNVDGQHVFYGYIFSMSFDKDRIMSVTCYDQLRYFKNKDTYVYTALKASEVLQMICDDFLLRTGEIEDTGYIIPRKAEQNKTMFDIVQSALDSTLFNTRRLYVLYDDFGKITLKNIDSMKVPLLIDAETGQNFDYTSSIDSQTYDQIKLTRDNKDTGLREVYMARDSENINRWGVLQFYETLQEGENGQEKADTLLKLYNIKSRSLSVKDAFGDIRVRAGTLPLIRLDLGEIKVNYYMLCDQVKHSFKNEEHTMDLTLRGGEFIG